MKPQADRAKLYEYSDGSRFKGKTAVEIFTEIEQNNTWTETESVSGIGSSLVQTKEIIDKLPNIFENFGIKVLLDIPCGDFNWMRNADLSQIYYTGGDIVQKIVDANNARHKRPNLRFIAIDLIADPLPASDLIFCRDCLVHLSFHDIFKALANIKKSNAAYLMMTTFPEEEVNKDIQTGGWRPLNLEKGPFFFPKPVYLLNEKCSEMNGAFSDKSLGLWRIKDL